LTVQDALLDAATGAEVTMPMKSLMVTNHLYSFTGSNSQIPDSPTTPRSPWLRNIRRAPQGLETAHAPYSFI
jgi:hypothetical protein